MSKPTLLDDKANTSATDSLDFFATTPVEHVTAQIAPPKQKATTETVSRVFVFGSHRSSGAFYAKVQQNKTNTAKQRLHDSSIITPDFRMSKGGGVLDIAMFIHRTRLK